MDEHIVIPASETLHGTLTLPETAGPHPVVILLAGSGQHQRDYVVYGFPFHALLAKELGSMGIATLRYDARGTGASTGSHWNSTVNDLVDDAVTAAGVLSSHPGLDHDRMGILGHSEGALVAQLAAIGFKRFQHVILLAGAALPVEWNILRQTELISHANGLPESAIVRETTLLAEVMNHVRSGSSEDVLMQSYVEYAGRERDAAGTAMKAALQDVRAFAEVLYRQRMESMHSPLFRSLLAVDPGIIASRLHCPVLALFGSKDLQVEALPNLQALRAALHPTIAQRSVLEVLQGANHLFQMEVSGSPSEYPTLSQAFLPALPLRLRKWFSLLK